MGSSTTVCGRSGVMVSALGFSSDGQWFKVWSLSSFCFLRQLASHPGKGEEQYSQLLHATGTGITSGHVGVLWLMATLPLYLPHTPLDFVK